MYWRAKLDLRSTKLIYFVKPLVYFTESDTFYLKLKILSFTSKGYF